MDVEGNTQTQSTLAVQQPSDVPTGTNPTFGSTAPVATPPTGPSASSTMFAPLTFAQTPSAPANTAMMQPQQATGVTGAPAASGFQWQLPTTFQFGTSGQTGKPTTGQFLSQSEG